MAKKKTAPFWWDYLGPVTGFAATVFFFISAWWAAPPGVSPIVLFVFAVVFGIVCSLAVSIIQGGLPEAKSLRVATNILLFAVLAAFLFILAVLMPSVFLGWPTDLRKYVDPDIVARKELPRDEPVNLQPAWGVDALRPQYASPGSGHTAKVTEKTTIWLKWLQEGGSTHTGTDKLVVYQSAVLNDYYSAFDGRLVFEAATDDRGNLPQLKARLAEGAAFLKHTDPDSGQVSFRQLRFYIPDANIDAPPETDALDNTISDIQINSGDEFWIIVRLLSVGTDDLPNTLDAYRAHVAPVKL